MNDQPDASTSFLPYPIWHILFFGSHGPVVIEYLLLETGDFFLLESGDKLIL